jgi:hypothetical protein
MKEAIIIFGVPAMVTIIMHELTFFGYRIYPLFIKYFDFKPFICELCMSFWMTLGITYIEFGFHLGTVLMSFLSGFIGYFYSKQFIKF